MFELSKQHTMVRPHAVLPAEIDQALNRKFGRPAQSRQVDVFGTGLGHIPAGAVSLPPFDPSKVPGNLQMETSVLEKVEQIHNRLVELELLRTGPDVVRKAGFDPASTDLAEQFIDYESSIGAAIRERGLSGQLLELAVRASDLGSIRAEVTEALESIEMTWDGFMQEMSPAEAMNFVDDLPTRYVTNVMRSAKLRQTQQKWEPNDFNDLAALPLAAVYCDVVVTEKQWVHRLRQGRIERRYNTRLLSDTAALADILVTKTS